MSVDNNSHPSRPRPAPARSRFNRSTNILTTTQLEYEQAILQKAAQLEHLMRGLDASRDLSLALQNLEVCIFWIKNDMESGRLKDLSEQRLQKYLQELDTVTVE